MDLKPANTAELCRQLADANARGQKIGEVDLSAFGRVLEHKVEDMTATVETGITLEALSRQLGARGQWLPVDPPWPERLSLWELLATNASGPRRFGFGTVRDYVIGMQMVLANGTLIHSGGKVVKNVAGYDLMKLFIGSRGSLGIAVQVTLKVLPVPVAESFLETRCDSLAAAQALIRDILDSELAPSILDLHNLSPVTEPPRLVIGFSGTREAVEWQVAKAAHLGLTRPASMDYQTRFFANGASVQKLSVLPSTLTEALGALSQAPYVARGGNGIIYHAGRRLDGAAPAPGKLQERLKNEFDPQHIFPALTS